MSHAQPADPGAHGPPEQSHSANEGGSEKGDVCRRGTANL